MSAFDFTFISVASFVFSCSLLYSLVETVLRLKAYDWIKKISLSLLVAMYAILGFYHYKTTRYFDFSIIADHWMSIWRPGSFSESLKVADSIFGPADYVRTVVAGLVMYFLVRYDLKQKHSFTWKSVLITVASFVFLFSLTPNPVDELTSFSKSAAYRVLAIETRFQEKYKPKADQELPLVRDFVSKNGIQKKPNVFFIFVESVNARFLEAKAPNGQEFTPFMNSLIKQGMYFERFYAQSIQTGRSHFASLCGLTPSIYGKEFEKFVDRKLNCLPEVLKENGYYTVFSKANEDVHFDNTYTFTTKHGFNVMNTMGKGCQNEDKDICWGWGIQDDIFYQRFFKYLDDSHMKEPVFGTLATISSHMPFNEVPENQRYIYKNPKNRLEYYSNALRVTDEYLKTFFIELKKSPYADNSIVFVMGDHSFPMGEHKNFQNETFAFEENFRTPLIILDFRKEKVIPVKRVKEAYSQVNLPATVLDLVGVSTKVHFQGDSLLGAPPPYVHLVQPYGGVYFSVIKYPYKYVLYDRSEKEYIFDLEKDPEENLNLRESWQDENLLESFRHEVGRIWFNYDMLTQDRVWR
ncbi:LTA synthase family protein [Bdellovibrio sp. HCB-110]|uniref:LTA synthase family protein n=1 Tax=Bdellovibrio sp. HCB-110 TaxID=3391182 RepID=UPI0039B6D5A6